MQLISHRPGDIRASTEASRKEQNHKKNEKGGLLITHSEYGIGEKNSVVIKFGMNFNSKEGSLGT